MDTYGDRGALDLVTVKNFTWQLLNVCCCTLMVIGNAVLLIASSGEERSGPTFRDANDHRVSRSATTIAYCTATSSPKICSSTGGAS